MNRLLNLLLTPEIVLLVLTGCVWAFCARHASGEGRDVERMERLIMLLPWLVVPVVFATVLAPGARNWIWLTRAVTETFLMMVVCSGRIISGFGNGARGQDAAFLMTMIFGTVAVALATSAAGAYILAEVRPAFGAWFRTHWILAPALTLIASVPIGLVQGFVLTVLVGVGAAFYSGFTR